VNELLAEIDRLKRSQAVVAGARNPEIHVQGPNSPSGDPVSGEADQNPPLTPITSVQTDNNEGPRRTATPSIAREPSNRTTVVGEAARNPLLEDRPWFISLTPEMPVLVGEATDAAFATRFRQALSGKTQSHFPRTQYAPNPASASLSLVNFSRPAPARARVLIKVALNTICRRYHLVQKSAILAILDQSIQNPAQCDAIPTCKLFAMFALGEAYSARATFPGQKFPGIDYYNNATHILRVLSEEPRIECIEVMAMLVRLAVRLLYPQH
jgi:proline utilization trans-activator